MSAFASTLVLMCIFSSQVLTETSAVHVRALRTFKDQMGINRKTGEEYLITLEDMESFIPEVYEEVVGEVTIITLTSRQYCIILNPIGNGWL